MQPLMNNKRAVGYFRVSSEEQVEGYSIAAQQRAFRQFVESHGYTLVAEYCDEGKSARTDNIRKRPHFSKMLQDVQDGLFDIIIVHKMDRFSRSLRVAVQAFEQLGKCNVGLVSISEPNLDYSSPQGKLFMHMLWALAQFYSDNLSQETKKGKNERKLQGFYNGTLPFGVIKGDDGLPVPDMIDIGDGKSNYKALLKIFQLAADGYACRNIAEELNSDGYRTTGNRGHNLFTKDGINEIVKSRFYLGELPDGDYRPGRSSRGNYTKGLQGKHSVLVPVDLWEAAQQARSSKTYRSPLTVPAKATTYSLSGLLLCHYCGGKLHIHCDRKGVPFIYCYKKGQGVGGGCKQPGTHLSVLEDQIEYYLSNIDLPTDYQQLAIEAYEKEDREGPGFERMRQSLQTRLMRLKEMFEWGDLPEDEYRQKRDQIKNELAALPADVDNRKATLEKLANFLKNVGLSWKEANHEQRNRLAKTLFETIEIQDKKIRGLTPTTEFTPLINLTYLSKVYLTSGSDGIRTRGLFLDREAC